jgi:hypothetical protein
MLLLNEPDLPDRNYTQKKERGNICTYWLREKFLLHVDLVFKSVQAKSSCIHSSLCNVLVYHYFPFLCFLVIR